MDRCIFRGLRETRGFSRDISRQIPTPEFFANGLHLQSFDSVFCIVDGTCGTGKMKDIVHLPAVEGLVDIDLPEFKGSFAGQMGKIGQAASGRLSTATTARPSASRASQNGSREPGSAR